MNREDLSRADPLFKGATRPAMFFGVPLLPFALAVAVPAIVGVYSGLLIHDKMFFMAFMSIPIIAVMRAMCAKDDLQFRLLGLRWRFRFGRGMSHRFWRASTYAPWAYRLHARRSLLGGGARVAIFLGKGR
jgi:type IV secretion system protein VirB3